MGIIAIRPPLLRCEFHAELPFVLIFGHKQSCWTVLSELRYKVAYNPNTFFLNWEQRTVGKAVKDACTAASKMNESSITIAASSVCKQEIADRLNKIQLRTV